MTLLRSSLQKAGRIVWLKNSNIVGISPDSDPINIAAANIFSQGLETFSE
jgi:hypothetical protein